MTWECGDIILSFFRVSNDCGGGIPSYTMSDFYFGDNGNGWINDGNNGGYPSGGSGGGSSGGAGVFMPEESIDILNYIADQWEDDKITLTIEFMRDPCLWQIWNAATESSAAFNMLAGFLEEFPIAELELNVPSSVEFYQLGGLSDNWAFTRSWSQEIGIYFNSNKLSNSGALFTASIIAHELIHAEMWRKLASLPTDGGAKDMASFQHDFPGLFDYLTSSPHGEHNAMANHYRPQIIGFLQDIDQQLNGTSNSYELYEALSWIGLQESDAWNQLSNTNKNNYSNIQNSENTKGKCH